MTLLISFLVVIIGFIVLAIGAHQVIIGASAIARKSGIPTRVIGLTIVAIGTSIPEIVIALIAALHHTPSLAIGNAIGSNIANIGLVLGLTTLIVPFEIRSTTLQKEWPILFLTMLIVGLMMLDGTLGRIDGLLLMIAGVLFALWLIYQGFKKKFFWKQDVLDEQYREVIPTQISYFSASIRMGIGFVLLPLSSEMIVRQAIFIARTFQVNDLLMGLTIMALGTSLPELANAIIGALKREYDLVIGDIIGSCIFNLLAVLVLPALITTIPIKLILVRDYSVMFIATILLFTFAFRFNGVSTITRKEGCFLIGTYILYLISLYFWH